MPEITESELVARAQAGDRAAFTALVHSHYGMALGYAQTWLKDYQLAQDATQEAFEQAFLSLSSLNDPAAFVGWLRRIVRHRCLRRFRQRDVSVLSTGDALETFHEQAWGRAASLPSELGEVRDLLSSAISTLPDSERDVVTLFHLMDCSQREIAAFLGLPLPTVNNRLHQARQRLKDWRSNMPRTKTTAPRDPSLSVGTIQSIRGPVVEVRFDSAAEVDVFDAIAVVGDDNLPVERMKVAHRYGDGRVICFSTSSNAARLSVGTSVLNSGQSGIGLTPFTPVPSVTADDVVAATAELAPRKKDPEKLLETGIKAVDLLCPIVRDGSLAQVGVAGVGRMALLDELRHALASTPHRLSVFGMVSPRETDSYRGWPGSDAMAERSNHLRTYWTLAKGGTDPEYPALQAFDTIHYCTLMLAVQGLYPALDPEYSTSRWLVEPVASERHVAIAARAREALTEVKRVYIPPRALELWAAGASEAARRAVRAYQPQVERNQAEGLRRARQLQFFLTQPFWTASEHTGWEGSSVPLDTTLDDCEAILNGEVEQLPVEAFLYSGTLDEVRERAEIKSFRAFA